MDLIIRNAQLVDQPAGTLRDIGIQGGKIVAIEPSLNADAQTFDAGGRLACAGLIETHIHLDKGRLNDVLPPEIPENGRKIAPVPYARKFKPQITEEDVRRRAEQTLRQCLIHGTTRIRSHVEVDPWMELRGFNAVASLIADYRWAVDLELCVFPQDGLTNLVEFAFGLDPKLPASLQLPPLQRSGGNLFYSFTAPPGVGGISYGAEWTTTLQPGDWHAIPDTGTPPAHLFSIPIGTNKKLFERLIITAP